MPRLITPLLQEEIRLWFLLQELMQAKREATAPTPVADRVRKRIMLQLGLIDRSNYVDDSKPETVQSA